MLNCRLLHKMTIVWLTKIQEDNFSPFIQPFENNFAGKQVMNRCPIQLFS